jgi:hypothetical protein
LPDEDRRKLEAANQLFHVDGSRLPENTDAAVEHVHQSLVPRLRVWSSPLTEGDGI